MTIDPVVAFPAVASIAAIWTESVEAALFRVYLPVLLLLPGGYLFGWPLMDFSQYAIIPIGLVLCWWVLNGRWKASLNDLAVFGFIGWTIVSDINALGTVDLLKRFVAPLTMAIFPYMAGKLLIEQRGLRVAVAKRFVFLVFIDVIVSCYEFRFAANPFRMTFSPLFSTVNPWFTQIRYGFGRVSGPFGHAIFMGTIVAIAIMLHRYIAHFGLWERQFRWLRHLPMRKQSILLFGLIVGILMTISRGPWLSAVIGVLIGSIGLAHNWRREFVKVAVTLIVGGGLVYLGGQAYFADAKLSATKEQVASAEYRTKLVDEYAQIAQERKLTGWGSVSWPQVQGMASIDNWYLLLTIMHGFTGLGAFVLMLILPIVQLFWSGMQNDQLAVDQRALIFTLVGIILAIGVSVITVYLGGQLYPLLFLFIGWSDACVIYQPKRVSTALMFAFRKVYA